jgi:DNA-binding NtrC family response regulator
VIFTRGYPIQAADLPLERDREDGSNADKGAWDSQLEDVIGHYLANDASGGTLEAFMDHVERLFIAEALRRADGNQTRAARLLGLPRPTLHARLQKHKLQAKADRQDG